MVGGLRAVGGGLQLILAALIGFAVLDKRLEIGEAVVARADDDNGGFRYMVADGGKAVNGIGAHLIDDGAGEVRQIDKADGLTVGIGISELGPADGAGTALNVFDDDGLADILLGVLGEDTGGVVRAGAGLIGDDHGDRAVGLKVGAGGDGQREHHAQDERES